MENTGGLRVLWSDCRSYFVTEHFQTAYPQKLSMSALLDAIKYFSRYLNKPMSEHKTPLSRKFVATIIHCLSPQNQYR